MEVPKWISKVVKSRSCPHCNVRFCDSGLKSIAIAEDKKDKTKSYLNLNYICIECKGMSEIFVPRFNMEDLVANMMEEYNNQAKITKKSKSKISQKEVDLFLEKMNKTEYFEDLLKLMGITEKELEAYKNV